MGAARSRRFAAADSAWLRMDSPTNRMHVVGVLMLREPVDFACLGRVLEERFLVHDRFRQRSVESFGQLGRPRWVPYDAFRMEDHVHRARLPDPGDERALQRFVSDVMSAPLDRSRPLWEFHYVENFGSGAAVVARLHHCIGDGVALVRLLLSLAGSSPDGRTPAAPPPIPKAVGRPVGPVGYARALGSAAATLAKLAFMSFDPRTRLKGRLGVEKLVTWSHPIPLDDVRRAGKALASTVNDVLLTAVAGALHRYLSRHHAVPPGMDLRAVVPVNLRAEDDPAALGNRFGLVFLPLPVGPASPVERLHELKRRMDRIKRSAEAMVVFTLLRVFGATSALVEAGVVRLLGKKATAVMTNVPGPREYLYLCGSRIDDVVFWVPQSGRLSLGVSIFSYVGRVRIGIAADRGLVSDADQIVADFHESLAELAGAAA
jgi:WS/DGAT/MGAT family acyltransferase